MSLTVSIRSSIEYSETLRRTLGPTLYSAWSADNSFYDTFTVANAATLTLPPATTYIIDVDPLATIVVGFVVDSVVVELPVSQLAVLTPPTTPYLRNTELNTSSNTPVPVKVIAFS